MYRCEICGKTLRTAQGLRGHERFKHFGKGPPKPQRMIVQEVSAERFTELEKAVAIQGALLVQIANNTPDIDPEILIPATYLLRSFRFRVTGVSS